MIKPIGGALWQWDTGRMVEISARPGCTVDEVHFYNGTTDNALVGVLHNDGEKITAEIPNLFLQSANNLVVYSIMVDDDGEQTTESVIIGVNKKPKPDDYVYTETEVLTWNALDDRIKAIEEGGIPGGSECEIKRIETAINGKPKINLRDLESGNYVLYGYFSPYKNSNISMSADHSLIGVCRKAAGSHIICVDPLNAKIVFFEILVDDTAEKGFTYTRTNIPLLELFALIEKVNTIEAQLPEGVVFGFDAEASGGIIPIDDALKALRTPVSGTIDGNTITLSGKLTSGETYTAKFDSDSGDDVEIGMFTA